LTTANGCRDQGKEREIAARAAIADGRFRPARELIERWLAADRSSAEAHYLWARAELAADRPAEALAALGRARSLGYPSVPLNRLALAIRGRIDPTGAVEPSLRMALRGTIDPRPEVAEALARIYLARYELGAAAEMIARWKRDAPEDPRPYLCQNEVDRRRGAAVVVLIANDREALRRDPQLGPARLDLADRLRGAGDHAQAAIEYDRYLSQGNDDVEGHLGAARTELALGKIEAAIGHLDRCLALNPRDPDALSERAGIDLRRRDPAAALRRLRVASQVDPQNWEIHYRFSQALQAMGDRAAAESELAVSQRLQAEHRQLEGILERLARHPQDAETRHAAASWLLAHGREDEGLRLAEQLVHDHPSHRATHELLADYYGRSGRPGLANSHRAQLPP
jgi:tetratricopeptide (TPR) repeat protein